MSLEKRDDFARTVVVVVVVVVNKHAKGESSRPLRNTGAADLKSVQTQWRAIEVRRIRKLVR